MTAQDSLVSVIVPTYREAGNLPALVRRIVVAMSAAALPVEILIVDDNSQDGSVEAVAALRAEGLPVRILVRLNERGLSSAVLHGFRAAAGQYLVCMDADLSHPPEMVPALVAPLRTDEADFVIGSRYVPGGSTDAEWSWFRRFNSKVATLLAQPLTPVKDPMAGFFALRRASFLAADPLSPIGYKIGLELLVKTRSRRPVEIPIHFTDRRVGESKLNLAEQLKYLAHLEHLWQYKYAGLSRFPRLCLVGASGMLIDLLMLNALLPALGFRLSRALAILVAMTWNLWLNRRITFSSARGRPWWPRYLRFVASCAVGGTINWLVSVAVLSLHPAGLAWVQVAALAGIACGTVWNFGLTALFVFPAEGTHDRHRETSPDGRAS